MSAFGFGFGLGMRQHPAGGTIPPAALSAISALVVQGATPIDPDGGGIGIDGDGWVAKAVMPFDAAATFDPSKIALGVDDPGFASDGTATVRRRIIRGGAVLRRQYPNQATLQAAQAGANLEVWFSLEEELYAGSTIAGAVAEAGYHGSAAAGSIAGAVNSSTVAYPKPLFGWLNIQHERAGGTHFAIEAVACHRHAMLGQQVACIEFVARDGSGGAAATQRAGAPSLSDFQTEGQRVEAWKAAIPLGDLAPGALCQLSAVIKPWIGAAWNLEAEEIAWPTANPQTRLRFLCDRDGGYGGAVAYIRAGWAGANAFGDPLQPYPTINAALAALPGWNLANKGHNDHSGATLCLMDDGAGGPVDHVIGANMSGIAAGNCLTDIIPDPANTALARASMTATRTVPSMLRWKCDIVVAGSFALDGTAAGGNIVGAFDGSTITYTAGAVPINYRQGIGFFRNVTLSGITTANQCPFAGFSTTRTQVGLALGCVMTDATAATFIKPFAMIGCDFKRTALSEATATVGFDSQDGMIVANNRMMALQSASELGVQTDYARGAAIIQNVFERAVAAASIQCLSISEQARAADNMLIVHNSIPGVDSGARFNWLYTDDADAVGLAKRGVARFNLFNEYNIKTDSFTTNSVATGRVGNWRARYGVGFAGNVVVSGDSSGAAAPDPAGGNFLGEHWEAGSTTEAGAGSIGFVDDRSGAARIGGGDYRLTGVANAAYDRAPAGLGALAFDLAGLARLGDGTGAAGAYERT